MNNRWMRLRVFPPPGLLSTQHAAVAMMLALLQPSRSLFFDVCIAVQPCPLITTSVGSCRPHGTRWLVFTAPLSTFSFRGDVEFKNNDCGEGVAMYNQGTTK